MMRGVKKFFFITLWQGPTNSKQHVPDKKPGPQTRDSTHADQQQGCEDMQGDQLIIEGMSLADRPQALGREPATRHEAEDGKPAATTPRVTRSAPPERPHRLS